MKVVIDWLLAQRQRLVIVAVVAAPLLPVVSAALLALETVRRGVTQGALSGTFVVGGLLLLGVLSRADLATFAVIGLLGAAVGVATGALIRGTGNLTFSLQGALLACFAIVAGHALFGPDPAVTFAPVLRELEQMVRLQGGTDAEVAAVAAQLSPLMPAVSAFMLIVGVLLLGYWWTTLAEGEPRFGEEFRALKLGRWLGAVATLVVALGLVFPAKLVQNLLPLALFAFLLQGLAVLHAWAHARRWHPGLLLLVYLLLFVPPMTVLVVLPLGLLGMVDNWLSLRTRWRSAA